MKPIFQRNFKFWQNLDNCANIFAIQHTRQVQFPKALWLQQALDPSYMCIASSEIQLAWISFRGTWCSVLLLGCVQKIDFCETSRWVFHLGNNSVCSRRNTNSSFSDRFLLVWINHVHLTKNFDHWFETLRFWNQYHKKWFHVKCGGRKTLLFSHYACQIHFTRAFGFKMKLHPEILKLL